MRSQRYIVGYGASRNSYAVIDRNGRIGKPIFSSASKSEVIAEAQRRNGFEPVDGDEQTYAKQTKWAMPS